MLNLNICLCSVHKDISSLDRLISEFLPVLIPCYTSCKVMISYLLLVRWQDIHKLKNSDSIEELVIEYTCNLFRQWFDAARCKNLIESFYITDIYSLSNTQNRFWNFIDCEDFIPIPSLLSHKFHLLW